MCEGALDSGLLPFNPFEEASAGEWKGIGTEKGKSAQRSRYLAGFKREDCTAESDNNLTKLQDRLVYLTPQLSKFPRDQKFVLGDRIEAKVLAVQEHCLRACYSRDKRTHLLEANLTVVVTRHLIRLAHGLRLVRNHTYGVLAEQMEEVGPMIGGWLKTQAVTGAPGGNGARTFLSAGPCLQCHFPARQPLRGACFVGRRLDGRGSKIAALP